jgi:ferric-dicitrate binding protein FerR (iron transport regulator)
MAAPLSMNLDRILELLAKQMGNAASEAELIELESLLQLYPNHSHLVSILNSIQSKKLKQPAQNEELIVKEGWEKLQQKLKEVNLSKDQPQYNAANVRSLFAKTQLRWAAAWIGLILLTSIIYFKLIKSGHASTMAPVQEAVLHGKPEMKILPDGTIVWINAGSKIRYKAEQGTRDVYLEGEAYFKVKHDAEHPFVVHAGNLSVRALGTEFNVSAYPGEDNVETTLIKGKVQVTMEEKPDQKIILAPNEKLTVVNKHIVAKDTALRKEISYEVKPVEILPLINEAGEVAWMQDKLAFQNESFSDLAKKMERRYNVHIVFNNESLKNESLSGIFENETIQKALRVLQMTTSFQYRMRGDSIYLNRP